jgi:hypothetical protein
MEKSVVGRAEQAFTRSVPIAADRLSLDFAVYVFKDDSDVSDVVEQRRKYMGESAYGDCLKQRLGVDLVLTTASSPPSKNAYVLSYEVGGPAASQFESYGWQSGNMLVTLAVTSIPPSPTSRAIVDAALQCFESMVESALRDEDQACPH